MGVLVAATLFLVLLGSMKLDTVMWFVVRALLASFVSRILMMSAQPRKAAVPRRQCPSIALR